MPMRVYATAADWYEFLGGEQPTTTPEPTEEDPTPDPVPLTETELNALLRRASSRIDSYTRTSVYAVDEDGYPTDETIADAFKWATCAQADWFTDTGDVTGAESQAGAVRIGSVQLGGGNAGTAGGQRTADDARTSSEALDILRNEGLLNPNLSHS